MPSDTICVACDTNIWKPGMRDVTPICVVCVQVYENHMPVTQFVLFCTGFQSIVLRSVGSSTRFDSFFSMTSTGRHHRSLQGPEDQCSVKLQNYQVSVMLIPVLNLPSTKLSAMWYKRLLSNRFEGCDIIDVFFSHTFEGFHTSVCRLKIWARMMHTKTCTLPYAWWRGPQGGGVWGAS